MNIPGADALVTVFGQWPSFHDAEVVRIAFDRTPARTGPVIVADVYVFERTPDVGHDGFHVLRNHSLVSFRFAGVSSVSLDGFNCQNVLWDLEITRRGQPQDGDRGEFEVTFDPSHGLSARISCREVTVEKVVPLDGRPA